MPLELLFLGTGTSAGVPMIGCDCDVCTSHDPRDQRTRSSVLLRYGKAQVLIDTSPEMRLQVIRHQINRIDAVMITHTHADHIFGLDDLRRFNAVMQAPIDLYADDVSLTHLRSMFSYIFNQHANVNKSFVATLITHTVQPEKPFELHNATWTPLPLLHGRLPILGYRIDFQGSSIAYCTDVSSIPPQTYPLLNDLDIFVIDALRYRHHPTHMTVDQALSVIDQIKPKRAYLTHIAHEIRHADLESRLPEHVYLSFDGLTAQTG